MAQSFNQPAVVSGVFRIAIIGGGVVGRCLGQALIDRVHRAGLTNGTVVIRRFEAPPPATSVADYRALELWPNAFAALDTVRSIVSSPKTAMQALVAKGYALERYDFRGLPGNLVLGIPTGALARGLSSETRVFTPEQLSLAVDTVSDTVVGSTTYVDPIATDLYAVQVHASHTLTAMSMEGSGTAGYAKLVFNSNSAAPLYADLVLAADGANSTVRQVATYQPPPNSMPAQPLFPQAPRRVSRLVCIVGETQGISPHEFTQAGVGYVTHGNDIRFGAWPSPDDPHNTVRWILFLPASTLVAADPVASSATYIPGFEDALLDGYPRVDGSPNAFATVWSSWLNDAVLGADRRAWLGRRLKRCMEGMHGAAVRAVESSFPALSTPKVRLHVLADRAVDFNGWFNERVALVGDAAHPILPDLGQGCGLSFEDVEALARRLSARLWPNGVLADWINNTDSDDLLRDILTDWRAERHDRAAAIVGVTRAASEAAHLDHAPAMVRDVMTMGAGGAVLIPSLLHVIRYRPPDEVL